MARVIFLLSVQARVIFLSTEEKFFRNQPIRNKNCLWRPCLLTDWDKISNLYRGPSIDASYQVSVQLAKQFQKEDFQKSTNQKQEWHVAAMFVNELGRNEHYLQRTFRRCFLPNFSSFGKVVSEKIAFLEINQSETRIACGSHVC